jgi:hypothetical protein
MPRLTLHEPLGWLLSERLPHILDWDLAPCAGGEILQFEGTVLNAPEPGHFMPQRFEKSSDFTVFPLDQNHFQMRFTPGTFLNFHAVALEALTTLDHSDYGLCGLCLSEFSTHRDQIGPHDFMGRISKIAR